MVELIANIAKKMCFINVTLILELYCIFDY